MPTSLQDLQPAQERAENEAEDAELQQLEQQAIPVDPDALAREWTELLTRIQNQYALYALLAPGPSRIENNQVYIAVPNTTAEELLLDSREELVADLRLALNNPSLVLMTEIVEQEEVTDNAGAMTLDELLEHYRSLNPHLRDLEQLLQAHLDYR